MVYGLVAQCSPTHDSVAATPPPLFLLEDRPTTPLAVGGKIGVTGSFFGRVGVNKYEMAFLKETWDLKNESVINNL